MVRYYFHLRDGEDLLLDPEGQELPSLDAVRKVTLASARSIISNDVRGGRVDLTCHVDVEDASGAIVHSLPFEDAVEFVRAAPVG